MYILFVNTEHEDVAVPFYVWSLYCFLSYFLANCSFPMPVLARVIFFTVSSNCIKSTVVN